MEGEKKKWFAFRRGRISSATEIHINYHHENILFDGVPVGLKCAPLKYVSCDIKQATKQITGYGKAKNEK